MAIDFGSTANSTASAATSLTYALNNVAGNVLTVGTGVNDGSALHVTGVTYNAVAMTKGVTLLDDSPGSQTETGIWYLASPATGSNNVVVTSNASLNISSGAISLTGANTSSPVGASTTKKQGDGTSCTQDLTTTFANSMVVDCWDQSGTSTANAVTGLNQTSRWVNSTTRTAFGSTKTTTTAGAQTMAWSWTTSRITGGCLLEIKQAGASYTMAADQGSFAFSGQATGVNAQLKMAAGQGSYTLSGQTTLLTRGYTLIAEFGSFVLTGIEATFKHFFWSNDSKNASTWTDESASSSSWTNEDRS